MVGAAQGFLLDIYPGEFLAAPLSSASLQRVSFSPSRIRGPTADVSVPLSTHMTSKNFAGASSSLTPSCPSSRMAILSPHRKSTPGVTNIFNRHFFRDLGAAINV